MLHLRNPRLGHKDRLEPSPSCGGILIWGSVYALIYRKRDVRCAQIPQVVFALQFSLFT